MPPASKKKTSAASDAVHFVTGSDDAEVRKTATGLAAELAPSDDPFAVETIDGDCATADEAASAIESTIGALLTLPFFGGGKLVWLKNASFLQDTRTGGAEAVHVALERLIETLGSSLAPGVQCLISAPNPDKRRSGYKSLSKLATLHLCDNRTSAGARRRPMSSAG